MIHPSKFKSNIIFAPVWESLNLTMPLLLLGVVLWFGFQKNFTSSENLLMRIIAMNILGDGYHVMYSLWNLIYLEEFKRASGKLNVTPLKWAGVFTALIIFFAIGGDSGFFKNILPVRFLAVWLICLIPTLHRNRQSMGLSLLYNMKHASTLTSSERSRFEVKERISRSWEHRSSWLLLAGTFIFLLSERPERFRYFHKTVTRELAFVLFAGGLLALGRAIAVLRRERALPLLKSLFSVRQLFQVLAPFSAMAQMSAASVHGVEYSILQGHMMRRSVSLRKVTFAFLFPLALFLVVDTSLDAAVALKKLDGVSNRLIINSMIILSVALAFLHYAMDSVYFRFKNPAVRENILPLIAEPVSRPAEAAVVSEAA